MEDNGSKSRLMREIQMCGFTVVEANLYLDTHPNDQEALRFFEKQSKRLHELTMEYEEKFGRISKNENGQMHWSWVDDPWPWQMGV